MIATNQLLSIAFGIISNFTNSVHIPPEHVPQHPDDLRKIVVGGTRSPLDLWLIHKRGDEFWIRDGIVYQYQSPNSYFRSQDEGARARLSGAPLLSSNQVVELATNILRRLAKAGNPIEGVKSVIETTPFGDLPFYRLDWPNPKSPLLLPTATIEIDGRNGSVVSVALWARGYYDYPFAQEISNRVYTPDSATFEPARHQPNADVWQQKPGTNVIQTLIPKWLKFCDRLGLDPGNQTTIAEVNWESTFKSVSPPSLPRGTLYKIVFRNGVSFHCVNETIFAHTFSDAGFIGAWAEKPPDYWKAFVGDSTNTWENLAKRLDSLLVEKLGVSRAHLNEFTPTPCVLGTGGVSHCVVQWYETKSIGKVPQDSIRSAITVEFDLSTGQVKNLIFGDWELLKWKVEKNLKPKSS